MKSRPHKSKNSSPQLRRSTARRFFRVARPKPETSKFSFHLSLLVALVTWLGLITPVLADNHMASFNLIDIDIKQAASALQDFSGKPVTLEQRVIGKISLVSTRPLDVSGAVALFAATAREKGWHPELGAQGDLIIRATPLSIGDVANNGLVTRRYPVLYRAAAEASPQLRKLLSPRGSISAISDHALLVHDEPSIQDYILRTLREIDVEIINDITHATLQFASAIQVANALHRLAESASEPRFASIQANPSSNSLFWRGSDPFWNERLRNIIASFDKDARMIDALNPASLVSPINPISLPTDTDASARRAPSIDSHLDTELTGHRLRLKMSQQLSPW